MRIKTWACAQVASTVRELRKKMMARMDRMGCPSRWHRLPAQPRNNPAPSPHNLRSCNPFMLLSAIQPEHDMKRGGSQRLPAHLPDADDTALAGRRSMQQLAVRLARWR